METMDCKSQGKNKLIGFFPMVCPFTFGFILKISSLDLRPLYQSYLPYILRTMEAYSVI